MRNLSIVALFLLVGSLQQLFAQATIAPWDSVKVFENSVRLRNPNAGGLNVPEFSPIDLDMDGKLDLFIFDRSGRKVLTFLNRGTANQIDYDFAPQFVSAFPTGITDFALMRDFNCDNKADLFFGTPDGIKVYENTSTPGNLSFQLYRDTLFTDYGAGPALIYLYQGDIPDMVDVDGDSDLDLLAFNPGGTVVEWHKNMTMEHTGNCAGLEFVVSDRCWGNFQESGLNQTLTLGFQCRFAPGNPLPSDPSLHSGSTVAAFDEDADGDYELVIGDLLYDGLTYCHNAGTPTDATIDTTDNIFPVYDASVSLDIFVAAFFLDVNNDGKKDMLASPNGTNVSVNYNNSWYYHNVDPGNGFLFQREKINFLTEEMTDMGLGAYPVLFDHNGDGLLDLIVGNYSRKLTATNIGSGLTLYENTGTANAPVFTLVTRNYQNLTNAFNPPIFGMTPAFGDMDGDGDKDLVIGDNDGKLHYAQNTAAPGQPANFPSVQGSFFSIDIGQFASPTIVDIDRDGDNDLVVGEMGGTLNYFQNTGTPQAANFTQAPTDAAWGGVDTEPICCTGFSIPYIFTDPGTGHYDMIVGSEKGDLMFYGDIESELGGPFTLDQANFGNIQEGQRTAISGADLNGDNVWEWVVGNVRGGVTFYSGNGILAGSEAPIGDLHPSWDVFPNPTNGLLSVRLDANASGRFTLTLTDAQGRTVAAQENESAAAGATLNVSDVAPGIYFLRLDLNGAFGGVKRVNILR